MSLHNSTGCAPKGHMDKNPLHLQNRESDYIGAGQSGIREADGAEAYQVIFGVLKYLQTLIYD